MSLLLMAALFVIGLGAFSEKPFQIEFEVELP
jgi:hypothetical protein